MTRKPVVSLEDRVPQLKQRRKKRANKRLFIALALFILFILIILYLQSPLSKIQTVEVNGQQWASEEEIIEQSGLSAGDSYWTADASRAEELLTASSEIRSASVEKDFPNTISITVEEYGQVGLIQQEQGFAAVLENGIVASSETGDVPVNAPIMIGFDDEEKRKEMAYQLAELPAEVTNSISEIYYSPTETDDRHVQLFMNDGFEVSALIPTLSEKMVHYPSIISQLDPDVKGVINLEVGSYFRAYQQPEEPEEESAVEE